MSDQPRRNGGGRRRTQDEANLSHEEAIKKQKNREAAKKHREKKEKTLMALKKENELLEAKNEEYTEKQKKLKELIAQAERLIQQHREAGCCLPHELKDLVSLTDQSLHSKPVVVKQNSSDSYTSSELANAMEEDSANDESDKDPMALFSGESLPSSPEQSLVRPQQQRARHHSGTSVDRQVVGKVYRASPHLVLTHATPTSRHVAPVGNHQGQGQTTVQQSQNLHIPTSLTFNPHGHQVIKFKTTPNPGSAVASNLNSSSKMNVFQVNGSTCKLIYRDGNYQIIGKPIPQSEQHTCIGTVRPTSPITPDDQSPMLEPGVYPPGRGGEASQASNVTGNIPSAELLEGLEEPTLELNTSGSVSEDINNSDTEVRQESWNGEEPQQYELYSHGTEPTFPEQETSLYQGYSYTDDLNLSETPQHILRQIQSHNFQHQNREAVQSIGIVVNPDSSMFPDLATAARAVTLLPTQTLVRGHNLATSSNFRQDEQNAGRTNRSVRTPVACAPAILDMLSEAEVLPSLQDEIKESLSL